MLWPPTRLGAWLRCRTTTLRFRGPHAAVAIISEDRLSVDEACNSINYDLPIPALADVLGVDLHDAEWPNQLARLFLGRVPSGPEQLGNLLRKHTLTRGVLAAGASPSDWISAATKVVERSPDWGRKLRGNPAEVAEAVGRYVALISVARRTDEQRSRLRALIHAQADEPDVRWYDPINQSAHPLDRQTRDRRRFGDGE